MRIEFVCKTNKPYVMINTLQCQTDKGIITIDRDETEWTIEDDGTMQMVWSGCYVWDGEEMHYPDKRNVKMIAKTIRTIEFELEDDADKDYEIIISSYNICS